MACRYCTRRAPLHRRLALRAWMVVVGRAAVDAPVGRLERWLHDYSLRVCSVCLGKHR